MKKEAISMSRRISRRGFLKAVGAGSVVFGLGGESALSARSGGARPNLLIIHTDEHNFRTLGCYRKLLSEDQAFVWGKDVAVETPNIDWIADNGATCTGFYATTPVCSPSRGAFVSGVYPQNTPVVNNGIPLNDNIVTFAEVLRRRGYATGYAGKWHLDGQGKPQWEPTRKFGFQDNRYMFNRGHWKQLEDTAAGPRVKARNAQDKPSYGVDGADEKSFTTDFLADKTVEFIEKHKNEAFCFMVSIPDPHGPNTVRPPYDTMFDHLKFQAPRTMNKPAESAPKWGKKEASKLNPAQMSKYFGMVKCIDDNVGKILAALRVGGILDRTIVIFTSDHGDMCGEHGRHNKGVPYETSAKIPFVIYFKGKVKAGTVVREALSCVDFRPTILNLMGFATGGSVEGRDASALLATGKAPATWKDVAFMRSTGGKPGQANWLAVVTHRYKLVYSALDDPWLFDLEKDPDELTNFFGDPTYQRTVRELSKALLEYGRKHKDPYIDHPAVKKDLLPASGQ